MLIQRKCKASSILTPPIPIMADEEKNQQQYQFMLTLPFSNVWGAPMLYFHGFWYLQVLLPGAIAFRDQFKPQDADIFLASPPKSGTTWLKALSFAIINRNHHSPFSPHHPLLSSHPHDCVHLVDKIYGPGSNIKLDSLVPPRLMSVHMPYSILPKAVRASNCKIIYICRNMKDTFISSWEFFKKIVIPGGGMEPISFKETFDMYCEGVSPFGPLWDHQLEYWSESLRRPEKVLFLKYEDVMEDTVGTLKKLAEFVGCPFSEEEEREGVVEGIVKLCSIDKLRSVEANKSGDRWSENAIVKNSSYFRKGEVGDWKNYLTPEMAQRLDEITEEKLWPCGLSFKDSA